VYGGIARQYPAQIMRVLIRNVDNSRASNPRYQSVFSDIDEEKWDLFSDPHRLTIVPVLKLDYNEFIDAP
jgi:hypothetical protein